MDLTTEYGKELYKLFNEKETIHSFETFKLRVELLSVLDESNRHEPLVSQAVPQAVPEPNQQLFTITEVEEFLQDQKYRCWKYYCDVWQEIEDGIISNFHNAPSPQKFIDKIIVKS